MYQVYMVTQASGKNASKANGATEFPLLFSLVSEDLTRRQANDLAGSIRARGDKAAVYTGNNVRSCF